MSALSFDWPQVEIGQVCDLINGRAFKPSDWTNEGLPIVRIQNLNDPSKPFNRYAGPVRERFLIDSGDLLFAWSGSPGTSFGAHLWNGGRAVLNQHIFNMKFDREKIDRDFFRYAINHKLQELIDKAHGGVGLRHVTKGKFEETTIPLPPLEEQRRIAEILDAADALRRRRREALALLDTLPGAIFAEMFGDPANNPHGYEPGTISDLLDDVRYGTSNKAGAEGALPILRMGNITYAGRMDLGDLKRIDLPEKDLSKHTVRKGDILFNRTNSADLVGKTAIFQEDEPYAFAGYLVRARVSNGNRPEYVAGYLNSPHGKKVLRNMAKNIVGMANINAKEMQSIPILLAPEDKQESYAERCAQIDDRRAMLIDHLSHLETLFASLQSRAFAGEL